MKTVKTLFAFVLALFMANVASASGNLSVNFASNKAELTVVEISNTEMSTFEIELNDVYGENIYSYKTETPETDLVKGYDFSELEDGIYVYTVKIDKETKTSRFKVDNGTIEVLDERKSVEPIFTKTGNMLKVSVLNLPQENVSLYVYDGNSTLLTEAELGDDLAIHRAIDLSELRYGTYDVRIANSTDIFEYSFENK